MEITKKPYELQARWNANGEMQGVTIQYCVRIFENGKQISLSITDPLPLQIGIDDGFPVTDILDEINIQSLQNVDMLQNEKSALIIVRDNLKIEKALLISENENLVRLSESKDLEIESLKNQISNLESSNADKEPVKDEKSEIPLTNE